MEVVRESGCQFVDLWMRLCVIPADPFFALEYGVVVVKKLSVREVEVFKYTQLKPILESDAPTKEASGWGVGIEVQ